MGCRFIDSGYSSIALLDPTPAIAVRSLTWITPQYSAQQLNVLVMKRPAGCLTNCSWAEEEDMDDIVRAIEKIYQHRGELMP